MKKYGYQQVKNNHRKQTYSTQFSKLPDQQQGYKNAPQGYNGKKVLGIEDFTAIRNLGQGAYGEVMLVRYKNENQEFAMKILDKNHIAKEKKKHQVMIEKRALSLLNHPNFVKLYFSFQDNDNLYLVLDFIRKGDTSKMLKYMKKLPPQLVRFYAAEIVNMLEFLRNHQLAHRDLKPDNILISKDYHLKLTDFGTAKFMNQIRELTEEEKAQDLMSTTNQDFFDAGPILQHKGTFVGTKDYVSPQVLNSQDSGFESDLWALGCIVYLFYTGEPLFKASTQFLTFQLILNRKITFPEEMDRACVDFIDKLIQLQKSQRLGAKSISQLKAHPYFKGIDFKNLYKQKVPITNQFIKQWERLEKQDTENFQSGYGGDSFLSQAAQVLTDPNSIIKNGIIVPDTHQSNVRNYHKKVWMVLLEKKKTHNYLVTQAHILRSREKRKIGKQIDLFFGNNILQQKDIPLDKNTKAMMKKNSRFDVYTPTRTWYFKCDDPVELESWVDTINSIIKKNFF